MRVASWAFVVCTALSALGVFLPSVELQIAGNALSRRTSLSLYKANTDRDIARKLIASYERNTKKRLGAAIITAMVPRTSGRTKEALDDANDAMGTLDGITSDDVKTAGTIFAIVLWAFLGLHAIMGGMVFVALMNGTSRRRRYVVALVMSVLATAIAIATCLVAREVVWQANDELGLTALGVGVGAYLTPIASIGGLIAIVTVVVMHVRAGRAQRGLRPADVR